VCKTCTLKTRKLVRHRWLTPVVLATQEAEIRRVAVQSQTGQIACKTISQKKKITKEGWWSGSSAMVACLASTRLWVQNPVQKEKNQKTSWAPVVHTCNPSYLGGWDQEDGNLSSAWAISLWDLSPKNRSKMDWRCGSSGRQPALQVQSLEFKPQCHQKRK
jgi:hypothetical protein